MLRGSVTLATVGTIVAAAAASTGASAVVQPSRVIDRTLVCETGLSGGIREIGVQANSAYKRGTGRVTVTTGALLAGSVAGVAQTQLYLNPACGASRARVDFSTRGLIGGVVGTILESIDCATPRRVLVRVRGVFRAPVRLRRGRLPRPPLLYAIGRVVEGGVAVRTLSGKPLVLARLLRSGKVQVFAAIPDSCIPD
jgi:hypothetical protein